MDELAISQRPVKRPRLNYNYPSSHHDLQLKRARHDLRLKSRFEKIFEKYGKDFSETADEIDLETGEIVVDKGHLAAMVNETDPGRADSGGHQHLDVRDSADELGGQDTEYIKRTDNGDAPASRLRTAGASLGSSRPLGDPIVNSRNVVQGSRHAELDVQRQEGDTPKHRQPDQSLPAHRPHTTGAIAQTAIDASCPPYPSMRSDRPALESAWQAPSLPESSLWRDNSPQPLPIDLEDLAIERSPSPLAGSLWAPPAGSRKEKIDGRWLRRGQPISRRKWTKEENDILFKLMKSSKLTTAQMEPYFPGRTLAAIKIHCSITFRDLQRAGENFDGVSGRAIDPAAWVNGTRSEGNSTFPLTRNSKSSPLRTKDHKTSKAKRGRPSNALRSKSSPLRNPESSREPMSITTDDFDELGDYPLESRLSALRLTKSLPKPRRAQAAPAVIPTFSANPPTSETPSGPQIQEQTSSDRINSNRGSHEDSEDELADCCQSILSHRHGSASALSLRISSRSAPMTPLPLPVTPTPLKFQRPTTRSSRKVVTSPRPAPLEDSSEDELATPVKSVISFRKPTAKLATYFTR